MPESEAIPFYMSAEYLLGKKNIYAVNDGMGQ
jgi:hypothetical protein